MTDIEQKALALVKRFYPECSENYRGRRFQIAMAAIEQQEATKQELKDFQKEVSDRVKIITSTTVDDGVWRTWASDWLSEFIIPAAKLDPLVEIMEQCSGAEAKEGETWEEAMARNFRAYMEAHNLTIVELKNDD